MCDLTHLPADSFSIFKIPVETSTSPKSHRHFLCHVVILKKNEYPSSKNHKFIIFLSFPSYGSISSTYKISGCRAFPCPAASLRGRLSLFLIQFHGLAEQQQTDHKQNRNRTDPHIHPSGHLGGDRHKRGSKDCSALSADIIEAKIFP